MEEKWCVYWEQERKGNEMKGLIIFPMAKQILGLCLTGIFFSLQNFGQDV